MTTRTSRSAEVGGQRTYLAAFEALDREWRSLCRRHRRNNRVTSWARAQPVLRNIHTLADVIPDSTMDRTSTFQALVTITRSGDRLAARALLQLMLPGLVRLAIRLRSTQRPELADDLIAATWRHIARIQQGDLHCHTADYILRSARRDVFYRPSQQRREVLARSTDACLEDRALGLQTSPESEPGSESIARSILERAEAEGRISPSAHTVVWLRDVLGYDMVTTAAAAGRAPSSAYRLRQQAHRSLRAYLSETSPRGPEVPVGVNTGGVLPPAVEPSPGRS
jgi:DNA-directed RNA polymerase specialized sigma24 family protein